MKSENLHNSTRRYGFFVSPTVGMRLPEVFADPDKFDPDRFGPGREEHKASPYAYLGFGGGMH